MRHIEIVKTSSVSIDVFIDGEKQHRVVKTQCWFDNADRCMKFRIETDADNGGTYAQVFSDFILVYRRAVPDDDFTVTRRGRLYELDKKLVADGFTIGKLWQQGWTLDSLIASNLLVPIPHLDPTDRIAVPTFDEPVCATISDTTFYLMCLLQQRDAKGREKYGTTLDRKDLSLVDWLQHQTEELLDGAGYAQAAKREAERLLRIEKCAREVTVQLQGVNCGWDAISALGNLERALRS